MSQEIAAVAATAVDDTVYLVDVREPDEWAAGHAPAARHLPMMEIPARIDEVPRDRPVAVVCRSGTRSAQVIAYLQGHGYGNLSNLDGGMQAWAGSGRPMVSEDGQPARVI
ncbi:sulfurtransferase [Pilimelia anulata]|uniref:Sulfurtransferase n=1 Tax=Pilimelia anulata TaxID=53371 RepID=A0A8J3BCA9_9ACTN|nr:rhodanese-like domain-containing protein [Pilimelia anulata]GGK09055.1 sulfurtransferase [Pilimelia anulata]